MHILFTHHEKLPVAKYGGTERIIYWLMKEYVRLGLQVSYLGPGHESLKNEGINFIKQNQTDWRKDLPRGVDIIHLYNSPPFEIDLPYIVTMGGNGQPSEKFPLNTVFVSKKHAELHGSDQFVYNYVDPSEYPFKPLKKSWNDFLFLAKASWKVKNLDHCIKAVKKSNKKLHIAGGRSYWPSLNVKNYGMVGGKEKIEILNKCDALLFPVRWNEPFGIAIIEAMIMGLPVIGSPYGSLPELICNKTGHICHNLNELIEVVKNSPQKFNSEEIHQLTINRFSSYAIAPQYLSLYKKIISGQTLNSQAPITQINNNPTDLLPF